MAVPTFVGFAFNAHVESAAGGQDGKALDHSTLDVAMSRGLTRQVPNLQFSTGLSIRFQGDPMKALASRSGEMTRRAVPD